MKLNKLLASSVVIMAFLTFSVEAVSLQSIDGPVQGVQCSANNLGKVVCQAPQIVSLADDEGASGGSDPVPEVGIDVENGTLDINGKPLDRYQLIMVCLFFFQILFCIAMCFYAHTKVEEVKRN